MFGSRDWRRGRSAPSKHEEDPVAEAYCVKDKKKVEIKNPDEDHHEERQARDQGHLPDLRRQRLPHRRLTYAGVARQDRLPAAPVRLQDDARLRPGVVAFPWHPRRWVTGAVC